LAADNGQHDLSAFVVIGPASNTPVQLPASTGPDVELLSSLWRATLPCPCTDQLAVIAMRIWLALIALIFVAMSPAAAEPKRVLLLHSFGPQFVPWVFFAGHFREELFRQSPDKIDLYEASLEGSRFQTPEEQRPIVDYLVALFGTRKLDLIVTIGAPATFFVQKYRAQFFPSVPLIIGAPEQRAIRSDMLTPNDAPVAVSLDFGKWIESILQVRPDTTHIAWVVGASPLERFWTEEFRRASQPFENRISFEWFNDLPFEDMLKRVSKLPPQSAAFFVDLRVDAAGVPLDRDLVLPRLRAATNAPVFSYIDSYLGLGIVGGPMLSSEEVGRRMAQAAVRILRGESPGDLKIPPVTPGVAQYDWRELQHWNISEDRLPAGSIVRFREPTVWQQHRSVISLISGLILLQGALISWLLHERRRRGLAEVVARERRRAEEHQKVLMAELDHRVKNVLARVAAVARSTRQNSGGIDEFISSFSGRLQSMAAAHGLLSKTGWRGVGLTAVIRNQLAPYATDANVTIVGEDVMLTTSAIQAVTMTFHELVTNAVKHGALSIPGGRVSVSWERRLNERAATNLILVWRELGGPAVPAAIQFSYGTELIRKLIPHELDGNVNLALESDGAHCRIEFSLES
jgi:two-component sensor histidine kinase